MVPECVIKCRKTGDKCRLQRQASSLKQKKQAFIVAYNLQKIKKDTGETMWNIVRVNEAGNQANYKYT